MWRGIVGRPFTAASFADYVEGLSFAAWRPRFIVVHNTSAPTLAQWHGKTPPEVRIKNLESYYRDQKKWSAGPHLFVADDFIWVFSPLTGPGVHSPSWNSISIGVEIVGEYNVEPFAPVKRNVVAALAALHKKLGLDPQTMRFHKEDPATTHKGCPGRNINKDELIALVRDELGEGGDGEPVGIMDGAGDEHGEGSELILDAPSEHGEHKEPLPAKLWRLARSKTQWAASGITATSLIGLLTDWRVLAVLLIAALAAYIIYERSKKP